VYEVCNVEIIFETVVSCSKKMIYANDSVSNPTTLETSIIVGCDENEVILTSSFLKRGTRQEVDFRKLSSIKIEPTEIIARAGVNINREIILFGVM
jgi:hypothetical protein